MTTEEAIAVFNWKAVYIKPLNACDRTERDSGIGHFYIVHDMPSTNYKGLARGVAAEPPYMECKQ